MPRPAALLLLVVLACSERATDRLAEIVPARHLLLITVDTLRADRLTCYGGRPGASPHIDALARQGVRFANAHAPMGMTLACITSLMTSKYPDETAVTYNQCRVDDGERTLAERLSAAGFRTRAFVANGVLDAVESNLGQGFRDLERDYRRVEDEAQLTLEAARVLKTDFGRDGRREFLWLHYMAPHAPYAPPEEHLDLFDPDYTGPIDGTGDTLDPVFVEQRPLAPRDLEHVRARYDGEVHYVDALLARVFAGLEASGAAQDTLVVFTADHGEELYDRRCYPYHANSLYASVTHVPLILRLDGRIPPATTHEGLAELVDVLPTALEYLGVPAEEDERGIAPRGSSLRRAIETGAPTGKDFTYAQVMSDVYLVRSRRWSYVRNPNGFVPRSVPEAGRYEIAPQELYDLVADPGEQVNVADREPRVVAQMENRLDAWLAGLKRKRQKIGQRISPERRRELEQLGYIDPDGAGD